MKNLNDSSILSTISPLYQEVLGADKEVCTLGDPVSTLNRLQKFFELFLSDGLNSEFSYTFGLKNV